MTDLDPAIHETGPVRSKSAPKARDGDKGERGGIQSLERASAILECVAARPEGITLGELSTSVGLHTSTAFHLTKTLVTLGYLDQIADSKRYRIGTRLFALAAGAANDVTLLNLATPVLERLSEETGEAAHLAVRSRRDIIMVARTAATGLLQLSERVGTLRPAHATAIGKMLLSEMERKDRDRMLDDLALARFTANTITDRAALEAELATIASKGIAHDRTEFDADVRCIAVPVRDFSGKCIAAMGLSGPVWRMTEQAVADRAAVLRKAAADLSADLGYKPR